MKKRGRKRGRKRHRGKVTPEVIEEMKSLREKGMSYQKIANRLGLNVMTVYNHLKKEEKVEPMEEKEEKVEEEKEEKVEEEKEEKVGLIERLKRALGRK